jgi:hypothetical protein
MFQLFRKLKQADVLVFTTQILHTEADWAHLSPLCEQETYLV